MIKIREIKTFVKVCNTNIFFIINWNRFRFIYRLRKLLAPSYYIVAVCQSLKVEMEKFLIKKRKTTESTDIRTVPGKIKLVYSRLPHNGIRVRGLSTIMTLPWIKKTPLGTDHLTWRGGLWFFVSFRRVRLLIFFVVRSANFFSRI